MAGIPTKIIFCDRSNKGLIKPTAIMPRAVKVPPSNSVKKNPTQSHPECHGLIQKKSDPRQVDKKQAFPLSGRSSVFKSTGVDPHSEREVPTTPYRQSPCTSATAVLSRRPQLKSKLVVPIIVNGSDSEESDSEYDSDRIEHLLYESEYSTKCETPIIQELTIMFNQMHLNK